MPRRRKPSSKGSTIRSQQLGEVQNKLANVLQINRASALASQNPVIKTKTSDIVPGDNAIRAEKVDYPSRGQSEPYNTSVSTGSTDQTAALHDELASFRQKWKRELKIEEPISDATVAQSKKEREISDDKENHTRDQEGGTNEKSLLNNENKESNQTVRKYNKDSVPQATKTPTISDNDPESCYESAKKLFLIAVSLEQDEMPENSIRYYKQAMHLYPDIEKRIFREQCEESAKLNLDARQVDQLEQRMAASKVAPNKIDDESEPKIPLLERIQTSYCENLVDKKFVYCNPNQKFKKGTLHLSDLPHELLFRICCYVVGQELDLASLESMGMVCRGFYLLSREQTIWRSICHTVWGSDCKFGNDQTTKNQSDTTAPAAVDWYRLYLEKPRLNFDGLYISSTKYIRQGDSGFQDFFYRPFHAIRYYRYLRFFPDRRVLILTTTEDPDKIKPIFRNATHAKQFSPDLPILEGTYQLTSSKEVFISAEKHASDTVRQIPSHNHRRQAQFYWSRQTPISQRYNLIFSLKTAANRPSRNNVLKWLSYTILARMETGDELTEFDISPDTFPHLGYYRVKGFNMRLTKPLLIQ